MASVCDSIYCLCPAARLNLWASPDHHMASNCPMRVHAIRQYFQSNIVYPTIFTLCCKNKCRGHLCLNYSQGSDLILSLRIMHIFIFKLDNTRMCMRSPNMVSVLWSCDLYFRLFINAFSGAACCTHRWFCCHGGPQNFSLEKEGPRLIFTENVPSPAML